MKDFILKTEDFIIKGQHKDDREVHTYVSDVGEREVLGGALVVLMDGQERDRATLKRVTDGMRAHMTRSTNDAAIQPQESVEDRFVEAIAALNDEFQQRGQAELKDVPYPSSLLIAFIANEHLSLAVRGDINAFLARHREVSPPGGASEHTLERPSSITDILNNTHASAEIGASAHGTWDEKLFRDVITGHLQSDDTVVFLTPNLLDYISIERLKRILISMPLFAAREELNSQLSNVRTGSFGIIIGKVVPRVVTIPERAVVNTRASLEGFIITAKTTAKILTPSFSRDLARILEQPRAFLRGMWRALHQQSKKIISYKVRSRIQTPNQVAQSVSKSPKPRASSVIARLNLPSMREKILPLLPRESMRGIVFLGLFILLLIVGIAVQGFRVSQRNQSQQTLTVLASAQADKETYQAATIYQDLNRSRQALSSIEEKLSTLTASSNDPQIVDLASWLEREKKRVWKITTLEQPAVLIEGLAEANRFALLENALIVEDDSGLESIDLQKGTRTALALTPAPLPEPIQLLTPLTSSLLVYLAEGGGQVSIVEIDLRNKSVTSVPLLLPDATPSLIDLAVFNGRIYLLDAKSKTVYRLSKDSSGYHGTVWFSQNTGLSDPKGLAVDGDLYVLDGSRVKKFSQGKATSFALEDIRPKLETPRAIVTGTTLKNLYIADPAQARILVFSKEGVLVKQYSSADALSKTKHLAISADEKMLYALSDHTVYSISLLE